MHPVHAKWKAQRSLCMCIWWYDVWLRGLLYLDGSSKRNGNKYIAMHSKFIIDYLLHMNDWMWLNAQIRYKAWWRWREVKWWRWKWLVIFLVYCVMWICDALHSNVKTDLVYTEALNVLLIKFGTYIHLKYLYLNLFNKLITSMKVQCMCERRLYSWLTFCFAKRFDMSLHWTDWTGVRSISLYLWTVCIAVEALFSSQVPRDRIFHY